jgi:alpha-mannosidase
MTLRIPLLISLVAPLFLFSHPGQTQTAKRIYIAPDDHTDYIWRAGEEEYRAAFLQMIDYYLDRADQTQNEIPIHQSRWNCDGSFWMYTYEKNKSAADFDRFMSRVKDGHISVPLNALCLTQGATPLEAVLRGMYYPGRIERQYNHRFRLAYTIENQSQPHGIASLWAGSGARYSWKGICNCDTRVFNPGNRPHEIYWHGGPDGSRILMKWNSLIDQDNSVAFANESIGGYAEARNPDGAVEILTSNSVFLSKYPFSVAGAFGAGWDDLLTLTDEFVEVAKAKTNSTRTVIVSNEKDFFEDFEATHGGEIPTVDVSFGNDWELYLASMTEVAARPKRAIEKLRSAEAMASLVSLQDMSFMQGREDSREKAWMNYGLFYEHNWGMVFPPSGLVNERIAWQRRLADEIDSYVDTLAADAATALGAQIAKPPSTPERFFVFNPLGWVRSDFADYPFMGPLDVHVVEVESGVEVPSQVVEIEEEFFLRIWAEEVPSVGYKTYEIRSGNGANFSQAAVVQGAVISNDRYAITVESNGSISSLIDKSQSNRQFAQAVSGRLLNDLGSGPGTLSVENVGPVSVTVLATSTGPLLHRSRITLFRDSERIDIRNDIDQNFTTEPTWGFGFALSSPQIRHEEVGAILLAKRENAGGDYSNTNTRYDWFTLNHFADISSGAAGPGVTLSNWDCHFMRIGNSDTLTLDTATPLISVLAGGKVANGDHGLPNQGGDNHFLQRFALRPHDGYNASEAMRFALEHQNPFTTGTVTGGAPYPASSFSLVETDNPNVLLWGIKPAEEGIEEGLVARFWNLANSQQTARADFPDRRAISAQAVSHIETVEAMATLQSGDLVENFLPSQIRTFQIRTAPDNTGPFNVNLWILY